MKNLIATLTLLLVTLVFPAFAATGKMTSSKSDGSRSSSSSSRAKAESVETIPAVQETARELAEDLTSTQETKLLAFLNEASIQELAEIKGISTRRGAAIDKARPFESVDEVILIAGIGEGTFAELVKHGKTLTRSRSTSKSSKK